MKTISSCPSSSTPSSIPLYQRMAGGLWARLSLVAQVMLSTSLALAVAGFSLLLLSTSKEADFLSTHIEEHLTSEMEAVSLAISEWVIIGDYANIEQILRLRVKYNNIQHLA